MARPPGARHTKQWAYQYKPPKYGGRLWTPEEVAANVAAQRKYLTAEENEALDIARALAMAGVMFILLIPV